eukprot:4879674-Pleurochrysis_carterae.AAC.1
MMLSIYGCATRAALLRAQRRPAASGTLIRHVTSGMPRHVSPVLVAEPSTKDEAATEVISTNFIRNIILKVSTPAPMCIAWLDRRST